MADIVQHMKNIEIGEREDKWVWSVTASGEFALKDTYKTTSDKKASVALYNVVWSTTTSQSIHLSHGWLCGEGSKLCRRCIYDLGVVQSKRCVLCWRAQETENHLFCSCFVVKQVRSSLLHKAGYQRT